MTTQLDRKAEIVTFLKDLRERICATFETIEPTDRFQRTTWDYHAGDGGGEISRLQGKAFEKAAVNWSGVSGDKFPMGDGVGPFFATGVSLITHMSNPHAPTSHFNIRYIEAGDKSWFAGGYDLTPMGFPYDEDTKHFHEVAKTALDGFDAALYPEWAKNAAEYFYIPHWKCERGVGGIFFDHRNTGDYDRDLAIWKEVGNTFTDALMPILHRRVDQPYTEEEKEAQLYARSRYVEFNLLYDRGTKFGFQSGGNPNAILCSMPPVVKWP